MQSSRVHDAIDVAYLQDAKKGEDSLYKMRIWDVSQNVDRFKASSGILPCITPTGSPFASDRQRQLNGTELLLLQGMPLKKIQFARETHRDRQSLAGNAMSTTVIGSSLIATIICGSQYFDLNHAASKPQMDVHAELCDSNLVANEMQSLEVDAQPNINFDIEQLKSDAFTSSRLCSCEAN